MWMKVQYWEFRINLETSIIPNFNTEASKLLVKQTNQPTNRPREVFDFLKAKSVVSWKKEAEKERRER